MRDKATIAAAVLLCAGSPAAAQDASLSPWVVMSAVASPVSSREICGKREAANRHQQGGPERSQADDERCALPVGAGVQGTVLSSTARALAYVPLLTGLTMVIGTTAYLLANKPQRGRFSYPVSPD